MRKKLYALSILSLIGLVGCSDAPLQGQVHTNHSSQLNLFKDGESLTLRDGDFISISVEKKGKIFDSKLVLKTPSQTLKIKVPKTAYQSKKTFDISRTTSGLNVDLKGYPVTTFVREWDEQGTNQCDAGGDCGNFQYIYDSNGNISTTYWVSETCWGSQEVIWHKKLYHDTYKIEFEDLGYFQSHPLPREDNTVKEVLSACER